MRERKTRPRVVGLSHRSALESMLQISDEKVLSLALGLPDPRLLPSFRTTLEDIAREWNGNYLQYKPPLHGLKEHLAGLMNERGVNCASQNIVLTSGAQQGINLVTQLLLNRGGELMVDEFTYPGLLQVAQSRGVKVVPISADKSGTLNLDLLEERLREPRSRPRALYITATAQNPSGISYSEEKKNGLRQLASKYRVPVIEDDPYGFLQFNYSRCRALKQEVEDEVIYIGTLSKILGPGLRIGWIVPPSRWKNELETLKETADINTGNFAQLMATRVLSTLDVSTYVANLSAEYELRRDVMIDVLGTDRRLRYRKPEGGLFLWLDCNRAINTNELLANCLTHHNVTFMPGTAFSAGTSPKAARMARLCFARLEPEVLREATTRFLRALDFMS